MLLPCKFHNGFDNTSSGKCKQRIWKMFLVNRDKIRESKSQRDTKFHVRDRPNPQTANLENVLWSIPSIIMSSNNVQRIKNQREIKFHMRERRDDSERPNPENHEWQNQRIKGTKFLTQNFRKSKEKKFHKERDVMRERERAYLCFRDFMLRRPLPTVDGEQDEESRSVYLSLAPAVQNEDYEDEVFNFSWMAGGTLLPG